MNTSPPSMEEPPYPHPRTGGSLIIAYQVKAKKVLIVGGGLVASGRLLKTLEADADAILVSPREGLCPEVAYRVDAGQVNDYRDRKFVNDDLKDDLAMVMVAIDDPVESRRIYLMCKDLRIPVNIADVPPECDFYFGSEIRRGALQIMVSTNGRGPRLAAITRRKIEASLPPNVGDAVDKVGQLRAMLRVQVPQPEAGKKRMDWMSQVCEKWQLDELAEMDEPTMKSLLTEYEAGTIPEYKDTKARAHGESTKSSCVIS